MYMEPQQLIRLLKRIYCWMPHSNPIRNEVAEVIRQLGGRV